MLTQKYVLYVGADNETREVDTDSINAYLSNFLDGYTLSHSIGLWKGETEESVIVTILTDQPLEAMREITSDLRKLLKQTSIFMEVSEVNLIDVCQ